MKNIWMVGLVLMLFLAACAPAPKPEEKAPPIVPSVEEEAPPAPEVGVKPPVRPLPSERVDEGAPEPTEVVAPKVTMSPALRDLLKRHTEKVKSLQALTGGTPTNNLFLDTYYWLVQDGKVVKTKIKKYSEDYYVREGYYDTIYVNLGVGCCEELSRCKSHNVDNTGKKFDVDSSMSLFKSPIEWIKEVPADAQIVGPQTFNQRSVTYLKYTDSKGQTVEMWVDDTYGVPHKVVVGETTKYQYNDMLFNGLKDSNFEAPCD